MVAPPPPGNGGNNNHSIPMDVDEGPPPEPLVTKTSQALVKLSSITDEEQAKTAIDMLKSHDVAAKVAAAHKIDLVATVLGPQRTREELLPFLTDGVDDEDEVLLAMAGSLGRMMDAVGGPSQAHALLAPLELLLTVEETTVRQAAAASTQLVANILPPASMLVHYGPMLVALATKEWFTARMSAAALIPPAFARVDDTMQQKLLDLFAQLCRDDTPMVRRVAAQHLGVMVQQVVAAQGRDALGPDGTVVTTLMPLFDLVASNEQPDAVRLQTTENCVAFGQVMTNLAGDEPLRDNELALLRRVLPLIVASIDDRSWRVRWTAAAKFAGVIHAYDVLPGVMDALVPAYEKLLQDPEAEVRTAATYNLAQVAHCSALVPLPSTTAAAAAAASTPSRQTQDGSEPNVDATVASGPRRSVAERLVKRVMSLTEDDSEHVRAALAMVATELAPILGRDLTISHLVPPVLLLLRDAASEVRLNLISSLSALNEVIGVDLLSQSLLPAILDLAQDGKWRIRRAIIQHIPLLAEQLGKEFFTDKLAGLCVGWLVDDIASIRNAAADNLRDLTKLFGTEWALRHLLPSVLDTRENDSYLRRLTALKACSMMAQEMETEAVQLHILPIMLDMANDIVPNLRFNVARELQVLAPLVGTTTYEMQIVPILSLLMEDEDRDVRYYAEKATAALDDVFANEKA